MGTLEIRLLGGFELGREGRVLDQLPLRAARSLFAYLVLNRERAHTRDLLAGTFWPDFDDSRARRRLSQALWQVQTTIGEDDADRYLIGTPDTVRFNPDASFWLDVDQFEAELAQEEAAGTRAEEGEHLARAVDLYRGDLLAGFYDDWLFPDQDHLHSRFLAALDRLIDIAMAKGDYEAALVRARRLAQEDEFDEEAHRRVMRIAVLLGRHNEAIRQFEECRRILAEEMGSNPSPETLELYEATLADRAVGGRVSPNHEESPLFGASEPAPFVGRDTERSRLAQRLDEVLDGKGGVVLVEGESGVGKTRLLAEMVQDARWRGMDVLWGRSMPSGGQPYGPLASALGEVVGLRARQLASRLEPMWAEVLAPLAPNIGTTGTPAPPVRRADEQARMREAITVAFRHLADIGPTLVVLEDVHWADDDTIQALTQIAGRIADRRILFAVSYRHGEARERAEVWKLLRELDRMMHCERLSLAAYSPAQTEELIRRSLVLPEVSREFSERLHRETGGIPLFIVETLRALYEKDGLDEAEVPLEEAPSQRDRLPVTPTVHALIRHRLDGLEPGARKTLELVAVHDGELLLEEIVTGSELEDQAALTALDDLVRRRLVAASEGEFAVGHELLRRVVYDDLALSRRLDLHRRVALAIEANRPEEVELLAHHFVTARIPDRAADYLERAAQHAMAVHAYDTAALHLERASATLDEISAPDHRRYAVSALHEEVLDVLGRREEQDHVIRRLERFSDSSTRGDVYRRRAWWLAHQDQFPGAEAEAAKALALAKESNANGAIVSALTALGMIACFGGRAAEGVRYLEEAADFRGTDRRQEADARNALGQNLIDLQRFGEAESQLLAALGLYGDLEDARGQAEVLGMLGTLRMERGEPESAEKDFRRAIEMSRNIGYRHGEAVYQMNLGILYVITNRLGSALESFESASETYEAMGNQRGLALVQSNAAWLWHGIIGDDSRAAELVASSLSKYREIGDVRGEAQCLALLGSMAGRRGHAEEARELFEQALRLTTDAGDTWLTAQALREYAAFELENADYAPGLSHAQEAERLCKEFGMNDLVVSVRALIGRLYLRLGDTAKAEEAATRAMREIRPGIELAHLVPLALAEVAESKGSEDEANHLVAMAHRLLGDTLSGLPEHVRSRAQRSIPSHAAITEAWRRRQPETAVFLLPSRDAPVGRTITVDDQVPVAWTLHHPADNEIEDRVERRRHRVLRLLAEADANNASPTVSDIARALGASAATIRRDLASLRGAGFEATTRGSR